MALIGPIHSAKQFSWEKGVGVAEISDLDRPVASRLWDDACDVGFRLINPDTGVIEAFYLDHEDKDSTDEDTYGWHFLPHNAKLREAGVRVLVIND